MEFGKRAINKAQTKLDILEAMLDFIAETSFREMKVRDIAARVGITEMTFFNYFQSKDDLLRYFMAIWSLDQMALQLQKPLKGEAAIRRIFNSTALLIHDRPEIMVTLISHLGSIHKVPLVLKVEAAERFLRYPELKALYELPMQSGNDMLLQHLGEMKPRRNHSATLMHLASCFYGDALVAYTGGEDIKKLYKRSLDLILDNIR